MVNFIKGFFGALWGCIYLGLLGAVLYTSIAIILVVIAKILEFLYQH